MALSNADDLFVDRTFEFVEKTLFSQLWVVVVRISMFVSIPGAFFCLPSKDAHVYKQVLECLKTHGVQNPKRIHLDFELADIKAAKECYPDTELIGFDTHWKRNLRTHNGKCGLATFSNTDVIHTFLRHLWSLSLVPEEDVVKVWEYILEKEFPEMDDEEETVEEYNQAMEFYLMYFEQTWIGTKNRRTGIRGKPKFPHKLWNKFSHVLKEDDLTNNVSESWNSASKLCLPRNPSIWAVLDSIKKEEGLARNKLNVVALHNDADNHGGRTQHYIEKKAKRRSMAESYGSIPLSEYINIAAS